MRLGSLACGGDTPGTASTWPSTTAGEAPGTAEGRAGGWRAAQSIGSPPARGSAMPTQPPDAPATPQQSTTTGTAAGERIGGLNGEGAASGVRDDGREGCGHGKGDGGSDGALSLPPSPTHSSPKMPSAGESAAGVEAMTRMLTWLCCSRATGDTRAGRRRSRASSPLSF